MDQDGEASDESEEIIDGKMRVETSRGQAIFGGIFSGIFAVGFSLMPLAVVIAFLAEGSDEIYFLSCIASVFGAVGIGVVAVVVADFLFIQSSRRIAPPMCGESRMASRRSQRGSKMSRRFARQPQDRRH